MPTDTTAITFLMVGCQRCGTTWVDAALRGHPQIYLPFQKQTYFFDRNHDKGLDWYLSQFDNATDAHKAVGEIATGYSLPDAIPRMAAALPLVKLIMTVRHPIDRAYSFYQSRKEEQGWQSFDQAIDADPEILSRGHYIDQINLLRDHYPPDRLRLLFYDDLQSDDAAYLRSILEFLEVDADFKPHQLGQIKNAAMFPGVRKILHKLGLKPVVGTVSKSPLGDVIRRARKRTGNRGYGPMDPTTRSRLIDYYRPYNDRLAAFAGRDMNHWNQ